MNWIRNAPRTEIEEIYQKLGGLVADGSLSAAVQHVYPLDQFKEAFKQSLKPNRSGKILFQCGATDVAVRRSTNDLRNWTLLTTVSEQGREDNPVHPSRILTKSRPSFLS